MIWQRMIDRLTGHNTRRNSARSTRRRSNTSRRLRLESLQKRELLAGDMGAISGIAFIDADGNGTYDVGETLLQNVEVNLYLDNLTQNGQYDVGETLVGTVTTGPDGSYRFTNLDGNDLDTPPAPINQTDDGFYVLTFAAGAGGVQDENGVGLVGVQLPSDQGVQITDDTGVTAVTIDNFQVEQPGQPITETNVGQTTVSNSGPLGSAGGVLGDARDVEIYLHSKTSGNSQFEISTVSGELVFSNGGDVMGTALVQYDGGGVGLNPTGLGGVDLTDGGDPAAGLLLSVRSDQAATDAVELRVYTDGANYSTTLLDLPSNIIGPPQLIFVPFSSFANIGSGADFTNIGALEVLVDGVTSNGGAGAPSLDLFVQVLESQKSNEYTVNAAATVPLVLGGEVFLDNGNGNNKPEQNNGLRDVGTEGLFQAPAINPIEVQLFDTDPSVGSPTPIATTTVNPLGGPNIGHYSFTSLTGGGNIAPGTYYVLIPETEFTGTGPLAGYQGSDIATPNGVTNDNADDDNDGTWVSGLGFVSGAITLTIGAEPSGGGNENTTVDFGVLPTTDLRIDKTLSGTSNAVPGGTAVFTVTVQNLGPMEATGITVSDVVPEGLTFVNVLDSNSNPVTTTSSTNGDGRPVRTFTVPNIAAGAGPVTYTINMTIDANLTANPINQVNVEGYEVEIDADPTDADRLPPDPLQGAYANNTAIETVSVPMAELTITKSDGIDAPATTIAGNDVTYTVVVENIGGNAATNVIALDELPAGVSYVAGSGTFTIGDGTVELVSGGADDGKLRITFGDLAPNESETVTFTVTVDPDFTAPDSLLSNSITVGADNAQDASATDETPVAREVDVTVGKTVIATRTPADRTDNNPANHLIDTTAPFEVYAGGFVTYQIVATNSGPSVARGVTVTDTLDTGLSYVTGSLDPLTSGVSLDSINGQVIVFNIPNLAPGESRTFTFEAAIGSDQFAPLDNEVVIATTDPEPTGHDPNTASVQIEPAPRVDLILEKTADVTTVVPGQDSVTYTFTVSHDVDSISDAINVDVTDILPAGLTGVTVNAPGASNTNFFNTTTRQVLVEYATIPVGETRTFTLTANVNHDATGTIENSAEVTVPGVTELDPDNNTSSVTINVTPEFDVTIDKSVNGSTSVGPLDNVTFTIVVSHDTSDGPSPSLARDIVVTDVLPTGLTFVSATAGGSAVTPTSTTGGNIVFPAFDLAPGATRTLTITASVNDDASGELTNNVSLVAAAGETDTDNNISSAPITVVPQADVYLTKAVDVPTAQPGSELTYTVTVYNDGPSPAAAVSVVDTLPSGVTFVSGTGPNGALSASNGTVTVTPLNNTPLASGASFQFTIIARVNDNTTAAQTNSATVSTSTQEIANHKPNTASVTTAIDQAINELSGTVFRDFNDDGIQNGMDDPLAGIELLLTGGDLGPAGLRTTTDANGFYQFDKLMAGDYQIQRLDMPEFFLDGKEQAGAGATPADSGDTINVTLGGTLIAAPENNFALVPYLSYKLCIV